MKLGQIVTYAKALDKEAERSVDPLFDRINQTNSKHVIKLREILSLREDQNPYNLICIIPYIGDTKRIKKVISTIEMAIKDPVLDKEEKLVAATALYDFTTYCLTPDSLRAHSSYIYEAIYKALNKSLVEAVLFTRTFKKETRLGEEYSEVNEKLGLLYRTLYEVQENANQLHEKLTDLRREFRNSKLKNWVCIVGGAVGGIMGMEYLAPSSLPIIADILFGLGGAGIGTFVGSALHLREYDSIDKRRRKLLREFRMSVNDEVRELEGRKPQLLLEE